MSAIRGHVEQVRRHLARLVACLDGLGDIVEGPVAVPDIFGSIYSFGIYVLVSYVS